VRRKETGGRTLRVDQVHVIRHKVLVDGLLGGLDKRLRKLVADRPPTRTFPLLPQGR